MNTIVNQLLEKVNSNEERVRQDAVTDISFILEMHAWNLSKDSKINRYKSLVRREIIELELNNNQLKEIVNFLKNKIESNNNLSSSIIFAIGKASSNIGLEVLLDIINKKLSSFEENEFYQLLISLETLIFFDESMSLEKKIQIIKEGKVLEKVSEKILSLQPISRVNLKSTGLRLLARLILLVEEDKSVI